MQSNLTLFNLLLMKRGLFIAALLIFTSMSLWAEEYPYVLRHCLVGDTIATLQEVGGPTVLAVEANLTEDINKVEVVQRIDNYTVAWYGPKWKDYSSFKSDENGYCWWTCPELKEGETRQDTLASGSGTSNHIGIIIPKGQYRFTIDYSDRGASLFIIEKLPVSALTSVKRASKPRKIMINNQVLVYANGKYYNALGEEINL